MIYDSVKLWQLLKVTFTFFFLLISYFFSLTQNIPLLCSCTVICCPVTLTVASVVELLWLSEFLMLISNVFFSLAHVK